MCLSRSRSTKSTFKIERGRVIKTILDALNVNLNGSRILVQKLLPSFILELHNLQTFHFFFIWLPSNSNWPQCLVKWFRANGKINLNFSHNLTLMHKASENDKQPRRSRKITWKTFLSPQPTFPSSLVRQLYLNMWSLVRCCFPRIRSENFWSHSQMCATIPRRALMSFHSH